MGLPNIEVVFKSLALNSIKSGERGIVALILKDTVPSENPIVLTSTRDIPDTLSEDNKEQVKLAFMGGVTPPKKVVAYILKEDEIDYKAAQDYLETVKFDYLAVPELESEKTLSISSWIKELRDSRDLKVKAVLPNCEGDHEGIINFATTNIRVGNKTYNSNQYCSRIAGILAGSPLTMSCTYQVLKEIDDVPHLTKEEFDKQIDDGKLVLIHDGEKVKIARAINSLTTLVDDKSEDFKKIKIIDIMDMIHDDIKRTVEDNYIGKVTNSYDSKCMLIIAISTYLETLEQENLLDKGKNNVSLDIDAQTLFLKGNGIDISKMNEQEIKEANTGSNIFLSGNAKILDAMEDFQFNFLL